MPPTIHDTVTANLELTRGVQQSVSAQTEVLRRQLTALDGMIERLDRMNREGEEHSRIEAERHARLMERHDEHRAEAAQRHAEEKERDKEHHARMEEIQARNDAQHEMHRLAMVQLLDRLNDR